MEVVGEGTYGKVYEPPVPCMDEVFTCDNCVGKVYDSENVYEIEYQNNLYLNQIDPDGDYHIRMIHSCKVDKSILGESDSDDNDDDNHSDSDDEVHTIIFEKGQPLQPLIRQIDSREKMMDFLKKYLHILQSIDFYVHHDFAHLDIKTGNIVEQKNTYKLIDLGLGFKISDFEPEDIYSSVYRYWAPYVALLNDELDLDVFVDKFFVENSNYILDPTIKTQKQLKDILWKYLGEYDMVLQNADAYAAGIILFEMLSRVKKYTPELFKKIYKIARELTVLNIQKRKPLREIIREYQDLL